MPARALILGPGSYKGFLLIGGLLASFYRGEIEEIDHYVGVSVGSILVTFLSLGMSFPEIILEALSFDLFDGWTEAFNDFSVIDWMTQRNKAKLMGLISPSRIRERVEFWLLRKYGQTMNFEQHFFLTGKKLTIVITNRSDPENPHPVYLNHETTPTYSVSRAVLESCAIPGLFESDHPHLVDGGLSDPFPIEQVAGTKALIFLLHDNPPPNTRGLSASLSSIYSAMTVPIQILTNQKKRFLNQGIDDHKLIILRRDYHDWTARLQERDKIKMIVQGFQQTLEALP